MNESGEITGRLSPFNPHCYMEMGRLLHIVNDSINRWMDIATARGELSADDIDLYEQQIHRNVKEIALALTGKKYVVKEEKK